MLILAVALLAQPAFVKGPLDVEVPNAIVDLHNRYGACLDRNFEPARVRDRAAFKEETERAISACAAEKAFLKQAAEAKLARTSDYADPERRQAAIAEAFDGYDRVRRAMAAYDGTAPRPEAKLRTNVNLDIPDEIAPAVVPYMQCLLASAGVPTHDKGKLVPPPPGIGKGSDCSAVRVKAAGDAESILKQAKRGSRAERATFVERVLVSMDKFLTATTLPPPPQPPTD